MYNTGFEFIVFNVSHFELMEINLSEILLTDKVSTEQIFILSNHHELGSNSQHQW
jgi:hypothetical protein